MKKSERTKEAILESARRAFARHSYEQAGVREIAAEAGVTAALVNRYFGSKQALFREALHDETDYSELYEGPRSELGLRMARFLMEGELRKRNGELLSLNSERMVRFVRSVGCPEATPILREALAEKITDPLMQALGGEDVQEKASLIISHIFGFLLVHRIIGAACAIQADRQLLLRQLAASFQVVIDG